MFEILINNFTLHINEFIYIFIVLGLVWYFVSKIEFFFTNIKK